jgi:hypothetical protein
MDIPASWSPPGGYYTLKTGDVLRAAPGLSGATIVGGLYVPKGVTDWAVESSIDVRLPAGFAPGGAVQVAGSRGRVDCSIDCTGQPKQGVQFIQGSSDVTLTGFRFRSNSLDAGDTVGRNHGIYFEWCSRIQVVNALFEDVAGGRALHFYADGALADHVVADCSATSVTINRAYGAGVFWGGKVVRNKCDRIVATGIGAKGLCEWGGGAPGGAGYSTNPAVVDANVWTSVPAPAPGWGYQPASTPQQVKNQALEDAYAVLKSGSLWSSSGRCLGYAVANPGEALKIDAYVADLVATGAGTPPVLATRAGRGLVAMLAALA